MEVMVVSHRRLGAYQGAEVDTHITWVDADCFNIRSVYRLKPVPCRVLCMRYIIFIWALRAPMFLDMGSSGISQAKAGKSQVANLLGLVTAVFLGRRQSPRLYKLRL